MARDIHIKSKLSEGEYRVFVRYQAHYGGTEAELIRKALRYFYVAHEERLETHERLIDRAPPVSCGSKFGPKAELA